MEIFKFLSQAVIVSILFLHMVNTLPNSSSAVPRKCLTLAVPTTPPASTIDSQNSTSNSWDEGTHQENNLQEILRRGMDQLQLDDDDKSAIFVLGNTGSGKTTLTQVLNGNLSQLHAVRTHRKRLIVIDDNDRIGLPTTTSKTLVPELVVNPKHNVSFYDCPGFDDNRGAETDIAAMYFVNSITEHVNRAKFLFTVTHSSLIPGDDRLDFDLLVTHASRFLLNMNKVRSSIGLVVTKVNSFSEWGEYLNDDELMSGIVEFIQQYKSTLQQQLNNNGNRMGQNEITLLQRKKQFVEAILEKENAEFDDSDYNANEQHSKIWFLRNPPQCGPFSEMPYIQQAREKIMEMVINKLSYTSTNSSDFGFTLKDKTRLKISTEYLPAVSAEMQNVTLQVINELTEAYQTEFENQFNTESGMREALLKLNQVHKSLFLLVPNENLTFIQEIQNLFHIMDYPVPESYLNQIKNYEDLLKFYEKVLMTSIQRPSLESSLTKLQNRIRIMTETTLSQIQETIVTGIKSEIGNSTLQVLDDLIASYKRDFWVEYRQNEEEMRSSLVRLNSVYSTIQNFTSAAALNHSQIYVEDIPKLFAAIEYPVPSSYENLIREKDSLLSFYENVTMTRIERPSFDSLINNMQIRLGNFRQGIWNSIKDSSIPNNVQEMELIFIELSNCFLQIYETNFEKEFNSSEYRTKEALRKLTQVYNKINGFELQTGNTFSQSVQNLFSSLEFPIPESNLTRLQKVEGLVTFFDETSPEPLTIVISLDLSNLQIRIQNMRESAWNYIIENTVHEIISEMNRTVTEHVSRLESCYIQHFYDDLNRATMPKKVEAFTEHFQQLEELRERWENVSRSTPPSSSSSSLRILSEFITLHAQMGCSMPLEEAAALLRSEEKLDFWREVVEFPIKSPFEEQILQVAAEMVGKLGYIRDWYQFLVRLETKLQSRFTKDEKDEMRASISNVSPAPWLLGLLHTVLPDLVSSEIMEIAQTKANEKDKLLLTEIVQNALSTTNIQCLSNGRKALVTGNYVRITDFMASPTNLPCDSNSNSSLLQDLEILASEAVIFDSDIVAKGSGLTIRIIAERWEVVGANRTINLKGHDGEPHLKAQSGTNTSMNGAAGQPGRPGGSGGNFYGVYGSLVNGEELSINVDGGDGGAGQEGGDGNPGRGQFDEDIHEMMILTGSGLGREWRNLLTCDNLGTSRANCEYKSKNPNRIATIGGNGGAGGSPGRGGYPGFLTMTHVNTSGLHDENEILVSRREGAIGLPGNGGKGGVGGKLKNRYSCTNFLDSFILGCEPFEDGGERAPAGEDGLAGSNSVGMLEAIPPQNESVAWNWETIIDFKKFVAESGNAVGREFVNVLNEATNINIRRH
ncbi:unnamed protein product [Orchesella dallaii]|uniref:Uncharacterized protein n=1 Tax=Orchesella dallaii TaxID=48710 RepID=A0ABP1RTG7_9HEXA